MYYNPSVFIATNTPWYVGSRQIYKDLWIPFFGNHSKEFIVAQYDHEVKDFISVFNLLALFNIANTNLAEKGGNKLFIKNYDIRALTDSFG
jgi:hypothetical protein